MTFPTADSINFLNGIARRRHDFQVRNEPWATFFYGVGHQKADDRSPRVELSVPCKGVPHPQAGQRAFGRFSIFRTSSAADDYRGVAAPTPHVRASSTPLCRRGLRQFRFAAPTCAELIRSTQDLWQPPICFSHRLVPNQHIRFCTPRGTFVSLSCHESPLQGTVALSEVSTNPRQVQSASCRHRKTRIDAQRKANPVATGQCTNALSRLRHA
ncbi:MAG: hypothetical protein ACI8W7_004578 [Gammaproteobacteria bacterium]